MVKAILIVFTWLTIGTIVLFSSSSAVAGLCLAAGMITTHTLVAE